MGRLSRGFAGRADKLRSGAVRTSRRNRLAAALLAVFALLMTTGCDDLIVGAWGANNVGQLGVGSDVWSASTPMAVDASGVLNGQTIVDIDAGATNSCALTATGTVACWGSQNGLEVFKPRLIDIAELFPGAMATQVAAGAEESCALSSDGRVACWGETAAAYSKAYSKVSR